MRILGTRPPRPGCKTIIPNILPCFLPNRNRSVTRDQQNSAVLRPAWPEPAAPRKPRKHFWHGNLFRSNLAVGWWWVEEHLNCWKSDHHLERIMIIPENFSHHFILSDVQEICFCILCSCEAHSIQQMRYGCLHRGGKCMTRWLLESCWRLENVSIMRTIYQQTTWTSQQWLPRTKWDWLTQNMGTKKKQ